MNHRAKPLYGTSIVFDLDGTLVNTAPDLQATLNHILETHGYNTVSPEITDTLIGNGAKAMLRAGLAHHAITLEARHIDAMFALFLKHYSENIAVHSRPYDGCITALERLADAGATLAVCTNKTQALADQLLETLGLHHYFAAIVGADSVPACKPDAGHIVETLKRAKGDQSQAIMVGDSQTDERAAHNAGLPFLFVPFGYGPIDNSQGHNRTILSHYNRLTAEMIAGVLRV